MIKVLVVSLVTALAFFAAGWISILVLGTNEWTHSVDIADVVWDEEKPDEPILISETVSGEKTWNITDVGQIRDITIDTAGTKMCVAPSKDGGLWINVKSGEWNELSINAECYHDGRLSLTVGRNWFGGFQFGGDSGTVTLGVPDVIYDELSVTLGTGSFQARDLRALDNRFDIGSGSFEYEQKSGFEAEYLETRLGSGSMKIANAAAANYDIYMGSGSFDVSGLTGNLGNIEVGSGNGTAQFAGFTGEAEAFFDLGSGKLEVYIPDTTWGVLYTQIGSGSVVVDCCGVSKRITRDDHITLNGESANPVSLNANLGSGKIELRNSSEYTKPNMFGDFPTDGFAEVTNPDDIAVESGVTTANPGFAISSSSQELDFIVGEVTVYGEMYCAQ